ncbi:MAG: hypothetical protein K1X75_11575 [Leptospirales bacterium]|nr:hypothetical protein [Leptospirales bacterium]
MSEKGGGNLIDPRMARRRLKDMYLRPVSAALILVPALLSAGLVQCAGGGGSGGGPRGDDIECRSGQISVWGEAPIFTSIAASRDKAKEDACRKAVEKCIGEEIASATGVQDGQSIGNEIFTQARAICRNDQVLDENQYSLDTVKMLRVFVRFEVAPSDIRNSINTMRELIGNPKVMVMIREEYSLGSKVVQGFASTEGRASALIRDSLIQKGYTVLDSTSIARSISNEAAVADNPDLLSDALKDRAAAAGADVLIIGRIESTPQQISGLAGTDFRSYRAAGNIKVLTLWGYGRLMGEYSQSAPGAQVQASEAARMAVQNLTIGQGRSASSPGGFVDWLHRRLQDEWAQISRNNQIKMTIRGLDQREAGIFRDNLIESTAVKKVNEISFSGSEIVWDIYYAGRSFALADTLGFYADNPQMFSVLKLNCKRINVRNVSRGEIRLEFTGAGCAQ